MTFINKYAIIFSLSGLLLGSCSSYDFTRVTSTTLKTDSEVKSVTVADLDVSPERVSYTMVPSDEVLRGGEKNVRRAAEAAVLAEHNNSDVLVDAQYVITRESGSFFKPGKISSITVTGHPARYTNFHSVPDMVWNTAVRAMGNVSKPVSTNDINNNNQSVLGNVVANVPTLLNGGHFGAYFTGFGGYNFQDLPYYGSDSGWDAGGSLTFGWHFNPQLFAGIGVAGMYNFEAENVFLPVYADVRYYHGTRNIRPFADLKVGYTTVVNKDDYKGGLYLSPAIGVAFGRFEVGAQYDLSFLKYRKKYDEPFESYQAHGINLTLGVRF